MLYTISYILYTISYILYTRYKIVGVRSKDFFSACKACAADHHCTHAARGPRGVQVLGFLANEGEVGPTKARNRVDPPPPRPDM